MQPGLDIYIYIVPKSKAVSNTLMASHGIYNKILSSYPGLHDPVKSFFLFLEKTYLATTSGLFVLPRPLSQLPDFPRADCFSSFSSQLKYHLLTSVFLRHSVCLGTSPQSIPNNSISMSSKHTSSSELALLVHGLFIISLFPEYKHHEGQRPYLIYHCVYRSDTQ